MAAKNDCRTFSTPGDNGSDNEDIFEDAEESLPIPTEVPDLLTGIEEAKFALDMFLNNQFEAAKSRMLPLSDKSMYHALAYGTIMYMQSTVTLEATHIEQAAEAVKKSVAVCNQHRKRSKFGSLKAHKKSHYMGFTDEEAHAELCYAECLLERAFLMFIQDENLTAMIKGALKIRECYRTYKECWKILKFRDQWQNDSVRETFESGVRMGVGAFNLLISLLPSKILKLLEFVGFSGNRNFGLDQLTKAAALEKSLRAPLCTLMLMFYYIFATMMLGLAEKENIDEARRLITPCMKRYSNSALFIFFSGRIDLISGNFDSAMHKYQASIDSQSEWRNVHHVCYWELLWSHCLLGDWLMAMKYAEKLAQESRWSKATYLYMKAAFLIQYGSEEEDGRTPEMIDHVTKLLEAIPGMIQRFAGKSLPIEKFCLKKSKRYLEQEKKLCLPAMEMIFVWNGFKIASRSPTTIQKMLLTVEAKIQDIVQNPDSYMYYHDDYCLALSLKGVILYYMGRTFQAQMCLTEVTQNVKKIKHDLYLLPWSYVELAHIYLTQEDWKEAKRCLESAKSYKGYSLESRLHFRMHAMSSYLKQREAGLTGSDILSHSASDEWDAELMLEKDASETQDVLNKGDSAKSSDTATESTDF